MMRVISVILFVQAVKIGHSGFQISTKQKKTISRSFPYKGENDRKKEQLIVHATNCNLTMNIHNNYIINATTRYTFKQSATVKLHFVLIFYV